MFFCVFILTFPPLVSNEKRRFIEKIYGVHLGVYQRSIDHAFRVYDGAFLTMNVVGVAALIHLDPAIARQPNFRAAGYAVPLWLAGQLADYRKTDVRCIPAGNALSSRHERC